MKIPFILPLLIVVSLLTSETNAQVGYEVQWTHAGVTYNGLIWETGYYNQLKMRVTYTTWCGRSMIEQDLTRTFDDYFGYFIGSNPRFISACDANQTYSADNFRWTDYATETMDYAGNWSVLHYCNPIYSKDVLNSIQQARYRKRR